MPMSGGTRSGGTSKVRVAGITAVVPAALGAAVTRRLTAEELNAWITAGMGGETEGENG